MTNTPPIPPPHLLEIVAFDGVQILDLTGPMQVFATANDLRALERLPPAYRIQVVSRGGGPVTSSCGLAVLTQQRGRGVPDTLLVPGGVGARALARDAAFPTWLARRAARSGRVVSVCTGAFLLAVSGMLDGLDATTHWAWCDALAADHPKVRVARDPIFVRSGRIWTSAGVTAGIDLCLALVEADLGRAMSLAVARHLVVFARRPGGQAQFSEALAAELLPPPFAGLEAFVKTHLHGDLSLPRLAARAGFSERSFLRHWRHPAGLTPARWVERMRLEAAQAALGQPGVSMKRVAARCGFGSEESLRRSFHRVLGVAPAAWRARFGAG